MKYCFYRMRHDTGFAPNPYHGYCTLAACTPNHMRAKLEPGDIIVGYEGEHLKKNGCNVLIMGNLKKTIHSSIIWSSMRYLISILIFMIHAFRQRNPFQKVRSLSNVLVTMPTIRLNVTESGIGFPAIVMIRIRVRS